MKENISIELKALRDAGQYIRSQRDTIIVINLSASCFQKKNLPYLQSTLNDISALHALGIKIILCFEACQLIDNELNELIYFDQDQTIDEQLFTIFSKSLGLIRHKIESLLSRSHATNQIYYKHPDNFIKNSQPLLNVYSGNFIIGKPKGIIEGKDFCFSGKIRKINKEPILNALNQNAIVLMSPIGHSPSGESFILNHLDIAVETANIIGAHKLIYFTSATTSTLNANFQFSLPKELSVAQTHTLINELDASLNNTNLKYILHSAISACMKGIDRCYLLDFKMEGALLLELLTRDGVGTMITEDDYDVTRQATIEDISGLITLIEPLENEGILVRRSREKLEQEIQYFWVVLRDSLIIGCGAIYPYEQDKMGEIACLTMHPDYRNNGRADKLLATLEKQTIKQGLSQIFALTTHTAHWFIEHGFIKANVESLPIAKQSLYNYQRCSQVFIKTLM